MSLERTRHFDCENGAQQITKPNKVYVDHQSRCSSVKIWVKNFFCTHNLQILTIYTFITYKYSFPERTLNDCNIFTLFSSSISVDIRWHNHMTTPHGHAPAEESSVGLIKLLKLTWAVSWNSADKITKTLGV